MKTTKRYRHSYSFGAYGYSVTMTDARQELKDWTRKQKQSVEVAMGRLLRIWSRDVVRLAKKYAPEFDVKPYVPNSNSLANSIVANDVTKDGSRLKIRLGVANTWASGYDEYYADKHGKTPPWGTSGAQVALLLHDFWDTFATERALESAKKKSAKYGGVKVGEKFLTRALEDVSQPNMLKVMAKAVLDSQVDSALSTNQILEF